MRTLLAFCFIAYTVCLSAQGWYLEYPPNVSKFEDLKERIEADEWIDFEYKKQKFHIARVISPSVTRTNEVVYCWSYSPDHGIYFLRWFMACTDVGAVEVIIDMENECVVLEGKGNSKKNARLKVAEVSFAVLEGR